MAVREKPYLLKASHMALDDNGWRCLWQWLLSDWQVYKTRPVAWQSFLAHEVTKQYMSRLVSLQT